MGISVWEQSSGDVRLQSSMRGAQGGWSQDPPASPSCPESASRGRRGASLTLRRPGCSRASRDGGRHRVLLQPLRDQCPAGTAHPGRSAVLWLAPWGPICFYRHMVPGTTVMALSCSLRAGCSKARPSSVSQSKRALPDTPDCGQRPWGCPRGATSRRGAGAGRAPAALLCLSSLKRSV